MTGGLPLQRDAAVFTLPDGRPFTLLERSTRRALIGLRLWEQGPGHEVGQGLEVRAHALGPNGAPWPSVAPVRAEINPDGVYVFHRLPMPRAQGDGSPPGPVGPPLVIEVRDRRGRFLPVALRTDDPFAQTELFLVAAPSHQAESPPAADPRFYLFASPTRTSSPRRYAAVRMQMWHRSSGRPAAHALVEVTRADATWYGLADALGRVLVLFPYPPVNASLAGSPPPAEMEGLYNQSWELTVRVRYRAQPELQPIPGFDLPDLGEIAAQPYAQLLPSEEGVAADSLAGLLHYGRELILTTAGRSELLLE